MIGADEAAGEADGGTSPGGVSIFFIIGSLLPWGEEVLLKSMKFKEGSGKIFRQKLAA